MRKTVIALLMASAVSAQAAEVTLSHGIDKKMDRDITVVSLGTSVAGFSASVDVSRVQDRYHSLGTSLGATVDVLGVRVVPYVGGAYVHADTKTLKNGAVAIGGVEFSLPLSKTVSLTADASYRWDVNKDTNYQGSVVTFGVKGAF